MIKYFNDDGKEVEPKDATWAQELEFDERGIVTKSVRYVVQNDTSQKESA